MVRTHGRVHEPVLPNEHHWLVLLVLVLVSARDRL
jgi:hypothetical protein